MSIWMKWKRVFWVVAKSRLGRSQAVSVATTDFRMSRRDGMLAPLDVAQEERSNCGVGFVWSNFSLL